MNQKTTDMQMAKGTKDAPSGEKISTVAENITTDVESTTPDGGWGWMIAIGCAIMLSLMPLLSICFSIMFSDFLLDNNASTTTTAWIFNTHTLLWNLTGPFAGPLTKEIGFRQCCLIACVMAALNMFACAFTFSTTYLLVFFSLAGLFGGMTCKPCYLIIPLYFDKRRGMASAILMAGMCTGQFVGPPFIRLLMRQYGFTGAIIIVSSILLNCCVGASFFQPVEWHLRRVPATGESTSESPSEKVTQRKDTESLIGEKEEKELLNALKDLPLSTNTVLRNRHRQVSESSNRSSVAISMIDLSSISHQPKDKPDSLKPEESSRSLPVRVIKSMISDLGILRYHRAQIIAFGGLFLINGYLNFLMAVPFVVQNAGFTPEDAAWCISITGVCNLIARLSSSVLSDYSWFNMQVMYVVGAVIIATSTAVFSFLANLTMMKVTLGCWAFGIGINISLYPLVMARIMGVENMPAIFGTQSLVVGIGYVALGPLIGYIRDVSGSYAVSIWVMSAEVWLCVILWCFMPAAITRDRKKDMMRAGEEAEAVI